MSWPPNNEAILAAIRGLFDSGQWWIYKGEAVRELEQAFARAHDSRYGVSVCNGTVALEVVLRALGIGPGDKVVLPAYDYYSLPKSVSNVGASPLFVDVCEENLTINVEQVHSVVREKSVKAVVGVHISGSVARVDELSRICNAAGVHLIEDCAQAAGAAYDNRRVGSWGKAGVFSFGGVKLMTCGQGGMITTSDPDLYEKCHAIVNRGMNSSWQHNPYSIIGCNYQLSELAAVTLKPQLEMLEELCRAREKVISFLDKALAQIEGLAPLSQFPKTTCRAQMRYSFYYTPGGQGSMSRESFIHEAHKCDIPLMPGYECVSRDPSLFQAYSANGNFPVALAAGERVVTVHHPYLLNGIDYWNEAVGNLRAILSRRQ